jgi:uncharacterized damage-inducible protein DinB
MHIAPDTSLLDALLDSWDRNNRILVNLLRAISPDLFEVRATKDGPSVGEMFHHIHYVRLVFVAEDAPQFSKQVPEQEWAMESDSDHLAKLLNQSAKTVREAVRERLASGGAMQMHYDHPILMLQHMIWHEGYHHGQIKLALKLAGRPLDDELIGPGTWGIWMKKTKA